MKFEVVEGGLHNFSEAGGVLLKRKERLRLNPSLQGPNVVVELRYHEVPVRHGVLVEPEPEHGGSRAPQEARLRRLVVRHRIPR